jgi:hypothetical protein
MLRSKIDAYKKIQSIKIEHKNTKDPNVIKLEVKATDRNTFDQTFAELNVTQKYLNLHLSEKDAFFLEEGDDSLKYFLSLFQIVTHRVFKIDENNVSLQIIGNEDNVNMAALLIEEFLNSKIMCELKEKEYEELKKKGKAVI